MSSYTVSARSLSEVQCTTDFQKNSSRNAQKSSKEFGGQLKPEVSDEEKDNLFSCSQNKAKEVNRTYVISACKKAGDTPIKFKPEDKSVLQRKTTASKESVRSGEQLSEKSARDAENVQAEKRLTLQRRVRTDPMEKNKINRNTVSGIENKDSVAAQRNSKAVLPPSTGSNDACYVKLSCRLAEGQSNMKQHSNLGSKDSLSNIGGHSENDSCMHLKHRTPTSDKKLQNDVSRSAQWINSKYSNRTSGEQLNEKGHLSNVAGKERLQNFTIKHNSLERPRTPRKDTTGGLKLTPKHSTPQDMRVFSVSASRKQISHPQVVAKKKMSVPSSPSLSRAAKAEENLTYVLTSKEEALADSNSTKKDIFKAENSKVTVAVRVRPFSNREKNENVFPVVSMSGSETVVQNLDTNQVYSFSYDFSFWSFDKGHPSFASQAVIYNTLAVPLLEKAFEGYNTCLFAYGQTGSGKSYTMMGFEEDRGIIPRFCEDLFTRVAQMDKQQILFHLEMSYFEVYNEKIHDLLVFKAESGQKKQPVSCSQKSMLLASDPSQLSEDELPSDLQSLSWLTAVDVPRLPPVAAARMDFGLGAPNAMLQHTGPVVSNMHSTAASGAMIHGQASLPQGMLGLNSISTHGANMSPYAVGGQPSPSLQTQQQLFPPPHSQQVFAIAQSTQQCNPAAIYNAPYGSQPHYSQPRLAPHAAQELHPKHYPKPIYSYSCLIAMALKNSKTGSLPVSEIYSFMKEHFPYFKTAPDGWKNSVRHNLSLNKCFEKVENKMSGTSRKGCLWALNPAKIDKMEEEMQKWKRKDIAAIHRSMANPEELDKLITDRPQSCRRAEKQPEPEAPPLSRVAVAQLQPQPVVTLSLQSLHHALQPQARMAPESPAPAQTPPLHTLPELRHSPLPPHGLGRAPTDFLSAAGDMSTEVDALDPSIMDFALQGNIWEDMKDDGFSLDALGAFSNSPLHFSDCELGPGGLAPGGGGADLQLTGLYGTYAALDNAAAAQYLSAQGTKPIALL